MLHSYGIPGRTVLKAGNVLAGRVIGQFRCDVGTVYANAGRSITLRHIVVVVGGDAGDGGDDQGDDSNNHEDADDDNNDDAHYGNNDDDDDN